MIVTYLKLRLGKLFSEGYIVWKKISKSSRELHIKRCKQYDMSLNKTNLCMEKDLLKKWQRTGIALLIHKIEYFL